MFQLSTCWRRCWFWIQISGSRRQRLLPTPTSPSTTTQTTSQRQNPTTRASRAASWRLMSGNVSLWLEILWALEKCCILSLTSWPPWSAGLTYEEVVSFEPPAFDGDEMESWGAGGLSRLSSIQEMTFKCLPSSPALSEAASPCLCKHSVRERKTHTCQLFSLNCKKGHRMLWFVLRFHGPAFFHVSKTYTKFLQFYQIIILNSDYQF